MFPGLGGMNPKKMQGMMKQLGIEQEDINDAVRVIIEKADETKIIIENPTVSKMNIKGNEMFQVTGEVRDDELLISEDDIHTVSEKTGAGLEESKRALEESGGDLAEAILKLSLSEK